MNEAGLKVRYLHSDIDTLERIEIIRDLRLGVFDILIGINLLREGLDIPECGLVAILDADKEGFLRSKTSLVQTIGRAARNVNGRVILYADIITGSLDYALNETKRRREKQEKYNLENNIKPESIIKNIANIIEFNESNNTNDKLVSNIKNKSSPEEMIKDLEIKMKDAAANLEFEEAAKLRDTIRKLEHKHLGLKLK
jgi:excinuclease ABC subunit B